MIKKVFSLPPHPLGSFAGEVQRSEPVFMGQKNISPKAARGEQICFF